MEVRSGVAADAVNQSANRVLFVEGSGSEAIDPRALTRLLQGADIAVRALGPSFHIKSAAQALHPTHPSYYFVIDRDHHDNATVESSWTNFPNPSTDNLLIWRKRELENYFLEPDYLSKSVFFTKCGLAELKLRLLKLAESRVFFDLANQTIASIREMQKSKWIEDFTNPADFKTSAKALNQLKNCVALGDRIEVVSAQVKYSSVEELFQRLKAEYLGTADKPELNEGQWLDRMRGKQLLSAIVNECFDVKDADQNRLTGREAVTLVAEELLQRKIEDQPQDFQELRKLIVSRISPTPS